jgi:hypothetical protein
MRSADRPEAARHRSDAASAGERRVLAARLMRLPDAHPSSPREEADAPESRPEAADKEPWWPEDQAAEAEDLADSQQQEDQEDQEDQDYAGDAGDSGDPDGPGGPADQPGFDRPGTPDSGQRAVGRPSAGGARGSGEPYRPWFADGDGGGDPWFTGDL